MNKIEQKDIIKNIKSKFKNFSEIRNFKKSGLIQFRLCRIFEAILYFNAVIFTFKPIL